MTGPHNLPFLQSFIRQRVGFQFHHENQTKPAQFIYRCGKFLGPFEEGAALTKGVRGNVDFFNEVIKKIKQQQGIYRPLDDLCLIPIAFAREKASLMRSGVQVGWFPVFISFLFAGAEQ